MKTDSVLLMNYICYHYLGIGVVEWPHGLLKSKEMQNSPYKFVNSSRGKETACCHAAVSSLLLVQRSARLFWGPDVWAHFIFQNFCFTLIFILIDSWETVAALITWTLKKSHNIKFAYFLLISGFLLIKLCIFNTSPSFLISNTW